MDFYEVISRRKTVREFEDAPIQEETLHKIIGAAFKAPTNDHMRDWHFIIISDRDVTAKLLSAIPKSISDADMDALIRDWNLHDALQQACYRSAVPKQYRMLSEASAVIVPLMKQKTDLLHPENISHLNGFASVWCSIENLLLAATAEGFGCSLRIPLGNEAAHAQDVLGFPEDYFMPCFIGIGRPKQNAAPVRQKEIDIRERMHFNCF